VREQPAKKNTHLLRYEDRTLFSHQKELFSTCRPPIIDDNQTTFMPKLILYTAPTGTGKTLSPIGLSNKNRIIFVCVAIIDNYHYYAVAVSANPQRSEYAKTSTSMWTDHSESDEWHIIMMIDDIYLDACQIYQGRLWLPHKKQIA
jgi:hypothetical protein